MALKKSIPTLVGINCEYWLLSRIETDKISQTAFCVLYGYPSKEVRDSGANYLERRFFNIYPSDYDSIFSVNILDKQGVNTYYNVYNFIKEHFDEFKDAEDVLEDSLQATLNMQTESSDVDDYSDYELYGIEL